MSIVQRSMYEIGVIFKRKNEIMSSGSSAVTCFLKFWEQPIEYTVRVVTNGLRCE